MQEDAVDDEHRPGRGDERLGGEHLVGVEVVGGRPVDARAARAQWVEHVGSEPLVVERVEPVALRRVAPLPVADRPDMVKVVDRDPHHGPSAAAQDLSELVGQHRLARAVDPVDRQTNAVGRAWLRDKRGHVIEQTLPHGCLRVHSPHDPLGYTRRCHPLCPIGPGWHHREYGASVRFSGFRLLSSCE